MSQSQVSISSLSPLERLFLSFLRKHDGIAKQSEILDFYARDDSRARKTIRRMIMKGIITKKSGHNYAIVKVKSKWL